VPAVGTRDDVGLRPIGTQEIKVDRRQLGERDATVAREGDGFQENLRQDHRGSAVQVHATLQTRHVRHEVAKIAQAAFAECRARRGGMHVQDVGTDRHVDRHRHGEPARGRQHARPRVLRFLPGKKSRDRLAETETCADAVRNRAVQ
jgi:hypothetical protein